MKNTTSVGFEMLRDRDACSPGLPKLGRRQTIQLLGTMFMGYGLWPGLSAQAAEAADSAFAAGSIDDALRALGADPVPSSQVALVVPDFVENGSVVPVEITSHFGGEQNIYIISEANPYPLVASFSFPEGTHPFVATRIKVARSCNIYGLVRSNGRFYSAVKSTTVTVGGCGA